MQCIERNTRGLIHMLEKKRKGENQFKFDSNKLG